MKKLFSIFFIAIMATMTLQAQDRKPDWARWHYLSEEEMNTPVRATSFTETPPPTGEPRFVGEFEPMQGVMIRYPLGIPTSLVADLANNCHVYCIVSTGQQNSAQNTFQNAGVNMNNVTFVNAPSDSYWVRDYGPWYIFEDRQPAIVDNIYNRPRPNDDNMSGVFANFWNIPMYGMNLEHTGGNMMEDGRGHGVSDNLVLQENSYNENNVRQKMRDYLGIDPYHITIDPQGDYIAHVDCWGKYLAPDKILIAQLPASNSHAADYDAVANYFATTNCCWGYPYRVYRVPEPGGYTLAPYTNSLILNHSVYVPMGDNSSYNQGALEVYQEAMPGYNIVPVYNNDWSIGWENTDALHCRTRGVMDFNMLFVDHREVWRGDVIYQAEYPVVSKFVAYSGAELKQDSLLVYYRYNEGEYQVAHMIPTGNPDEYVGFIPGVVEGNSVDYYVFGADESGHRYTQPVFADLDPHHFTIRYPTTTGELAVVPSTLWIDAFTPSNHSYLKLVNETDDVVILNQVTSNNSSLFLETQQPLPFAIEPGFDAHVNVSLYPFSRGFDSSEITFHTSIGEITGKVMVADYLFDRGLGIEPEYVELTLDEPEKEVVLKNNNHGTHSLITLLAITETSGLGDNAIDITMEHQLPYSISYGEEITLHLAPNYDGDFVKKELWDCTLWFETESQNYTMQVMIDLDLLSITEISTETKLYPNPTTGNFTVEGANVAKVEVYNLVGQKIYAGQGAVINIDASEWNKGIYLVSITNVNGAVETKKLVIN